MPPKSPKASRNTEDSKCGSCTKVVSDQDKGVCCDICDAWYHCKCQGVVEPMYKALQQYPDLRWFCQNCKHGAENILGSLARFQSRTLKLEEEAAKSRDEMMREVRQLCSKMSEIKDDIVAVGNRMDKCERMLENNKQEMECTLKDTMIGVQSEIVSNGVPKWSEIVAKEMDSKMTTVSDNMLTFQTTLQQQTRAILEDRQEQEEIGRRRCNLIVHGLLEPNSDDTNTGSGDAKTKEENTIMDLLHEMRCDDVSVESFVRLGRRPDEVDAKPRPLKLALSSEKQKEKVLKMTKNLKLRNSTRPDRIFIHQDFTPKQRERRKELVEEMKQRRASGEKDLILVNLTIRKKGGEQ